MTTTATTRRQELEQNVRVLAKQRDEATAEVRKLPTFSEARFEADDRRTRIAYAFDLACAQLRETECPSHRGPCASGSYGHCRFCGCRCA